MPKPITLLLTRVHTRFIVSTTGRRAALGLAPRPVVSIAHTRMTLSSETVALSYDSASRRASLTLPNGVVATYGYNAANQLTGISYAKAGTPVGDLSYEYDLAGQRVKLGGSLARMGLPDPVASATYNAANQLTSWDGVAHTYDANGNLTGDTSRTLTWDSRNRLASLSGPIAGNFSYDAMGRRKSKTVAGTSTSFLYDGLNIVQELNGANPQANLLTGQGIDEVFARTAAGGNENFVTDGLGSTIALTDAAGAVQTSYAYEAYGKAAKSGAATTNSQTYTGREDDGTGLYNYRARYYNPTIARFVSEDPIGLAGGINTYAYVEGNPIKWTDPLGLDVFQCGEPAFGSMPFDHQWIKTDTVKAGMGGRYGNETGNRSEWPGDPVKVTDHSGRSKNPKADCKKVDNVDEKKVNDQLKIGRDLGRWLPGNHCQSFVRDVLGNASTAPDIAPYNDPTYWGM